MLDNSPTAHGPHRDANHATSSEQLTNERPRHASSDAPSGRYVCSLAGVLAAAADAPSEVLADVKQHLQENEYLTSMKMFVHVDIQYNDVEHKMQLDLCHWSGSARINLDGRDGAELAKFHSALARKAAAHSVSVREAAASELYQQAMTDVDVPDLHEWAEQWLPARAQVVADSLPSIIDRVNALRSDVMRVKAAETLAEALGLGADAGSEEKRK